MSVALQFKLTQAGQAAVWNAGKTGMSLSLTHVQFGSGNRAPSGAETALLNPQQAVPIAAGFSVSPQQIRMSAIFGGTQGYVVREVGVWAGDPAVAGSRLVGYWSQASGDLAVKSPGVDFIFSHDMALDGAVPAGSLTILADQAQSAMLAMMAAHEAKPDPHPQYLHRNAPWKDSVKAATTASLAGTYAPGAAGVGATLTAAAAGALTVDGVALGAGDTLLVKNQAAPAQNGIYTVTSPGSTTAAWVLTRARFCDAAPGLAGAVTAVDQGVANGGLTYTNTFRATDVVGTTACNWRELAMVGGHGHSISDIAGLSADLASRATTAALAAQAAAATAALNAHEAKPDPHPQYTTDAEVLALIEARVGDYVVATGTANAVTVALDPPITAYTAKTAFAFKAIAANTGAVTINAGAGIRPLVREDGKALAAGDIPAGSVVTVVFDSASNTCIVTSAVASQVDERIAAHEAKADPHGQYATHQEVLSMFGAPGTAGALDWNDLTNTRPGAGGTLLLGTALNGPGGGTYFHPFNFEYQTKDGSGNVTQMAVAYGNPGDALHMRGRYNGVWTPWVTFLNSKNVGLYAPSRAGVGASGTWPISITGTAGNGVPVGAVIEYPSITTPAGYLKANGAAVSRTAYAALFAVIGTTFGAGDGSTTFNLPDRRDRMAIGAEGLYALGAKGGSKDAVVVEHSHGFTGSTSWTGDHQHATSAGQVQHWGSVAVGTTGFYDGHFTAAGALTSTAGAHSHAFSGSTSIAGTPGLNANLPPYLAMSFYIKF